MTGRVGTVKGRVGTVTEHVGTVTGHVGGGVYCHVINRATTIYH